MTPDVAVHNGVVELSAAINDPRERSLLSLQPKTSAV